jgi:hypothetical protein
MRVFFGPTSRSCQIEESGPNGFNARAVSSCALAFMSHLRAAAAAGAAATVLSEKGIANNSVTFAGRFR